MRDRHGTAPHQLHVAAAGEKPIALRRHVAVTDRDVRAEQPDRVQQLDRRHTVLVHDVMELDHAVGGVNGDRHPQVCRRLARGTQQVERARLHLAGHQQAAHATVARAVHAPDERARRLEFLRAGRLVHHARQPPARVADPAARIEARPEPRAQPAALDLGQQRLLHAQLAAEFHERRGAPAQQLGDRELRVQSRARLGVRCVGTQIARIAAHARALARHADIEERLAVVVGPAGVADEAMRRAMPAVHVAIDEAR